MANESLTGDYDDYQDYDDYYDNETEEECHLQELPHARWILPTLYSMFFLIGFLGNMVVIAVVSKRSSRRADTFILNLAVSDLLFVCTLPLWASALAQGGHWPFGTYLCQASGYVIAVTRCASSLLMAVMSIDRYVAVIKGKKMHPLRTRSCSLGTCCGIWGASFLVGCPTLVSRHLDTDNSACVDSDESLFGLRFKLVVIFLTFVLPFAVVLFCYCLRVISKLGIKISCSMDDAIHQALSATAALAFANSCSNPLIYALLDAGFRRRAQLSIPGLFYKCRSMVPIPSWTMPTTSMSMESTSTYTGNR
ncbi:putative G-protein coupled receptor 25 [Anomaloglossus baeobatrachus]|uniref:putative G-protein coupled receptor 25 n=1 Tax=Anomaloglossus baeobatrachus TaxID=238106 RepID=UPI003F4FD1A7